MDGVFGPAHVSPPPLLDPEDEPELDPELLPEEPPLEEPLDEPLEDPLEDPPDEPLDEPLDPPLLDPESLPPSLDEASPSPARMSVAPLQCAVSTRTEINPREPGQCGRARIASSSRRTLAP